MNIKKHAIITGRVQGVWFRASTREKATEYNINGWVKNNINGNVEAIFEGHEKDVEKIILWCHSGPPGAHVEKVEVKTKNYKNEFSTFLIKR